MQPDIINRSSFVYKLVKKDWELGLYHLELTHDGKYKFISKDAITLNFEQIHMFKMKFEKYIEAFNSDPIDYYSIINI